MKFPFVEVYIMKKIVSLFFVVFLFCNLSYAVKAYPGLITYKQPDGSLLKYYLMGDENYSYMVSEDGYLLSYDDKGFLVYGDLFENNGVIKPSQKRVKALSLSHKLDTHNTGFKIVSEIPYESENKYSAVFFINISSNCSTSFSPRSVFSIFAIATRFLDCPI